MTHHEVGPMDVRFWDERYLEQEALWSGRPNAVLVDELADHPPGRVLDVGCGEGGDAIWLAQHGWQVSAVDISGVALERARARAERLGESTASAISWVRGDVQLDAPDPGAFDLVSLCYYPLPKADPAAAARLFDAVTVGGTLLVVGHQLPTEGHGPPAEVLARFFRPADLAGLLDDRWNVLLDEVRARPDEPSAGGHREDTVLRAVRLRRLRRIAAPRGAIRRWTFPTPYRPGSLSASLRCPA